MERHCRAAGGATDDTGWVWAPSRGCLFTGDLIIWQGTEVRQSAAQLEVGKDQVGSGDVRRYWAYAAVLELLDPTPLVSQREASLAAFGAAVPIYEIGLTADLTRERMAELVAELMT